MNRRGILLFGCSLLAIPCLAGADDSLWSSLRNGGYVVLMRHAVTTPGVGDPPGMVMNDCATQRNLSDDGRAHAKQVGEAFRAQRVPVAQVISSPWCRCLETARLAFGVTAATSSALENLFGRSDVQGRQIAQLKDMVSRKPSAGNLLLVTHGSTVLALTGVSPAPAEMVVLRPRAGGQFDVVGRLEVPAR
jgi:broad specificity phosphatase PhoE